MRKSKWWTSSWWDRIRTQDQTVLEERVSEHRLWHNSPHAVSHLRMSRTEEWGCKVNSESWGSWLSFPGSSMIRGLWGKGALNTIKSFRGLIYLFLEWPIIIHKLGTSVNIFRKVTFFISFSVFWFGDLLSLFIK